MIIIAGNLLWHIGINMLSDDYVVSQREIDNLNNINSLV